MRGLGTGAGAASGQRVSAVSAFLQWRDSCHRRYWRVRGAAVRTFLGADATYARGVPDCTGGVPGRIARRRIRLRRIGICGRGPRVPNADRRPANARRVVLVSVQAVSCLRPQWPGQPCGRSSMVCGPRWHRWPSSIGLARGGYFRRLGVVAGVGHIGFWVELATYRSGARQDVAGG